MEHFIESGETSTQGCSYTDTTLPNKEKCNNCFGTLDCSISKCSSVCEMDDLCEGVGSGCTEEKVKSVIDLYKTLFGKMKNYFHEHDTLGTINLDFSDISNRDGDTVRDLLWAMLKDMYDVGTLNSKSNFVDKQRLENVLKSQEHILNEDGIILNNLKTADNTMKRQMEIDLNEFRKTQYNLAIIKQAIVFIAIILIIPALVKFNVIKKKMGIVIWIILLVVLLIYVIFMIVIKNNNRDDIDFREYNFVKPTDDEIARSRIAASMSKKDKAKCKALAAMEDDFDADSINIDITPYRTNEKAGEGQCFSG